MKKLFISIDNVNDFLYNKSTAIVENRNMPYYFYRRKNMKRILALLMALCMIFALAACDGNTASTGSDPAQSTSESATEGVTISLWTYPIGSWGDEATVKTFTDAFEAETGIKVKVEFLAYGGDGDNKINAALSANEAPDLVMEGPERLAVLWGAQGHMVDLSDMLDAEDIAEINPSTIAAFTISDGTLTGYPLCMNAHCMAINLDHFKAAGADQYIDLENRTWTTEGFINAVKALHAASNGNVAAVFCNGQGGDQGTRVLVNNLYSGLFIDADRTAYQWDSEENIKALRLLYDLDGVNFDASIAGGDEQTLFRQGILDMAFCWNIAAYTNVDSGNEVGKTLAGDEVICMNFPTDDGSVALNGGMWGFGIFNNGDEARIEAAKKFIKFVCDSKHTGDAVAASNFFPVRSKAAGMDLSGVYEGNDAYSVYNRTIMPNLGDYYTITDGFADVRTLWWNMLQAIGTGGDIPETVANYVAQANATLG